METDTPAPDEVVPAQGIERWQRVRRLGTSVSAVVAAIGIVSALIGYLATGAQFFSNIEEYFQGRSESHLLIDMANERLTHADYEAAWRANTKARELAPRNAAAAQQQARIAMKWLEDVRLSSAGGPQHFSDVVDPLKSALVRQLPDAHGREGADLHAHIGWANFLRYRDGLPKTDIGEEFDIAIREDPNNLYGHVMRGFWILWEGGPIDAARSDLDQALSSSMDPTFSDGLIMSGLTNITSDDFIAAAVEYADRIRQTGRNIDEHTKRQLIWYYSMCLHSRGLLAVISRVLPPSEQVPLLDWLAQADIPPADQRVVTYFLAHFAEISGKEKEALRLFADLARTPPNAQDEVARLSQVATNRLTKR